jgi:hypothetical protein
MAPGIAIAETPRARSLAAKERRMTKEELRRKLRAFPTGGLMFRLLTAF